MVKKKRLETTVARLNAMFKEKGNNEYIATLMHNAGDSYIDLRRKGILFMELDYEKEWIVDGINPITLKTLNYIIEQLVV